MIAHLRGTLLEKHPHQAIVECQGVGYDVAIPVSTFTRLPDPGLEVRLRIHTSVREDAIQLFGFFTAGEKQLFEKLISVSGIGPKLALTALSDVSHQDKHWGKDVPGDDDFDSLAEHLSCLYDECEILPRPERAVGSVLRATEVPAMRMLGRHLGALILELGEASDAFYTTDPRWFDVVVAAEAALVAMES